MKNFRPRDIPSTKEHPNLLMRHFAEFSHKPTTPINWQVMKNKIHLETTIQFVDCKLWWCKSDLVSLCYSYSHYSFSRFPVVAYPTHSMICIVVDFLQTIYHWHYICVTPLHSNLLWSLFFWIVINVDYYVLW